MTISGRDIKTPITIAISGSCKLTTSRYGNSNWGFYISSTYGHLFHQFKGEIPNWEPGSLIFIGGFIFICWGIA